MRIFLSAVFLLSLLIQNPVISQVYYAHELPDSLDAITLFKDQNGFLKIIARQGIYELNAGQLEKTIDFKAQIDPSVPLSLSADFIIASCSPAGFVESDGLGSCIFHDMPASNALLNKSTSGEYILLGRHIYSFNDNTWNQLEKGHFTKNWIVDDVHGSGIFAASKNLILAISARNRLDTLIELKESESVTAITSFNDTLVFASNGILKSFAISDPGKIIHSRRLENPGLIKELIHSNNQIYAIASEKIYILDKRIKLLVTVQPELGVYEEILSVLPYNELAFWVLTTRGIFLYGPRSTKSITLPLPLKDSTDLSYYLIRNNEYIAYANAVFRLDKASNKFIPDPDKKPPYRVFTPRDGHPVLAFKDHLLRIHKHNAFILDWIPWPSESVVDHILVQGNDVLLHSDKQVFHYRNGVINALSGSEGSSQIFRDDAFIYIKKDSSILRVSDKDWSSLISLPDDLHSIGIHDSQLFALIGNNQLFITKLEPEQEIRISLGNMEIDSLLVYDGEVLLAAKNALHFTNTSELIQGSAKFSTVPLKSDEDLGEILYFDSEKLIYRSDTGIHFLDRDAMFTISEPALRLELKDDGFFKVHHTNHWAIKPSFNYILSGEEDNQLIWTSKSKLQSPDDIKDYRQIKVLMKDDIYGRTLESNSVVIPELPLSLNYPLYLFALILIFASGLGALRLLKT